MQFVWPTDCHGKNSCGRKWLQIPLNEFTMAIHGLDLVWEIYGDILMQFVWPTDCQGKISCGRKWLQIPLNDFPISTLVLGENLMVRRLLSGMMVLGTISRLPNHVLLVDQSYQLQLHDQLNYYYGYQPWMS